MDISADLFRFPQISFASSDWVANFFKVFLKFSFCLSLLKCKAHLKDMKQMKA